MEKRETRYRVQWYYRLFEETQRGLTWGTSVEVVHGSLLALGELLRHTGKPYIHACMLCSQFLSLPPNPFQARAGLAPVDTYRFPGPALGQDFITELV